MRVLLVLLAFMIPVGASADSIRELIEVLTVEKVKVYEVVWSEGSFKGSVLVNAVSIQQAVFTATSQLKINEDSIVSVKIKK